MPFRIIRDDITRMQVDAIVNTANPYPQIGSGTDYAIYQAAGSERLLEARKKIGIIARGDAAITPAFDLNARWIIHTVGPIWNGGSENEEDLLRSCYATSLKLAARKKCQSIAFPLISTGNYGFPKELALQIVMSEIGKFLLKTDMMIYLVVFDSGATKLSEHLYEDVERRIDDHYAELQHELEYFSEGRPRYQAEYLETSTLFSMPNAPAPERSENEKKPLFSSRVPEYRSAGKAKPARSLKDILGRKNETFQEMLLRLIAEKGLTNVEAYTRANQDKKLFSKIKKDKYYQPKKKTAMAFALALELNLDETKDLMARAGYAFSPASDFDTAIQFFIETQEYDIFNIEIALYDLGLDSLCNYA